MICRVRVLVSFVFYALLAAPSLWSQAGPPPVQEGNQSMFAPLALAPANDLRTGGGMPGEAYWQQQTDYDIQVSLDPASHRVTGREIITYTNDSPDRLSSLWVQLDQNMYAPNSRAGVINAFGRRGAIPEGGYTLDRVEIVQDGQRITPRYLVTGTRMKIDLDRPLPPRGGVLSLEIDWSFVVPERGGRMGRLETGDGWLYTIAQWFPRMAVYDDVDGWNTMPYLGIGEFYLDYGSYDVAITVPHEFIVVATGDLENPNEVLPREQRERIDRARQSAERVYVIAPDEVGSSATRPSGRAPLTWRYHAEDVRDFAWAASPAFIWDAASWENVLIMSAYPKEGLGDEANPGWERSTEYSLHTIEYYSTEWFRYPYPVAINVAGPVGGMEYPMIVFCSVRARGQGLFGVTDHELGHSWFPMIVGSDERRYAWMDEGFNTFINRYSNLAFYGEESSRGSRTNPESIARGMQAPNADLPIMTYPDHMQGRSLGFLAYAKPATGLVLLRDVILGSERFDPAFRKYIADWAFKHPKPADFFRSIEDGVGEDLSWFWRGWFYTTDVLDQAVDSVASTDAGSRVFLSNKAGLVMPAEVEVTFADGTTERYTLPVEVWIGRDFYTLTVPGDRVVQCATVDPDARMPDVDRSNNGCGFAED